MIGRRASTASSARHDRARRRMARSYTPLKLHVPESAERPGREPDFSYLHLKAAGETRRPPVDALPSQTSDLAYGLVRVLDDEGHAVGPWTPAIEPQQLIGALR